MALPETEQSKLRLIAPNSMRHQKKTVRLGRKAEHRKALLANQVCSLIEHRRIKTTLAKAKAVRPIAEKMVTLGKNGSIHARRTAFSTLRHKDAVKKLFDEIAPRSTERNGGYTRIVPFANGGSPIEMPNFMAFVPVAGYPGLSGNGIHQIAGGLDSGGTFGAPVSLGCIRLNKFQSKLARWWTPSQAKFFVYFEPNRYRAFGDAATGRAKGFRTPQDPEPEIAAATPRPATAFTGSRCTPSARTSCSCKSTGT